MDGNMTWKDKVAEAIVFVPVAMSLSVLLMNAGDMPMGMQDNGCAAAGRLYWRCFLFVCW